MKVTEEELIEFIEEARDACQAVLENYATLKISQNTVMTGLLMGERDFCIRLLDFINNGE